MTLEPLLGSTALYRWREAHTDESDDDGEGLWHGEGVGLEGEVARLHEQEDGELGHCHLQRGLSVKGTCDPFGPKVKARVFP